MASIAAPTFSCEPMVTRSGTSWSARRNGAPPRRGRRRRPLEEAVLDHPVVVVELRQVGAPGVREHHEDARLGAEPLRHLHPGPRRRARRAADEQALLAREPTGGEERVAVGHAHPLVDDGRVERVRPALLADPLDEVRALGMLRVRGEDRALRIDGHDARLRVVLLEVAADAGDRARPSRPR